MNRDLPALIQGIEHPAAQLECFVDERLRRLRSIHLTPSGFQLTEARAQQSARDNFHIVFSKPIQTE